MGFAVGTYVIKSADKDKDDRVVYIVTAVESTDVYTIASMDDSRREESGVAASTLEQASLGEYYKTSGFVNPVYELAVNATMYAIIQAFRSGPTFGHRSISFLISDAIYELGLKNLMDKLVPFFQAPASPIGMGVGMGEFQDGILKTIPIVLIQQIVQKVMHKSKFSAHILKNSIDCAIACTGGNLVQRNIAAPMQSGLAKTDKLSGKRKLYRF
jgi:hypothetical protein